MDSETLPVIVAIGDLTDRPINPQAAMEPVALMAEAARHADAARGVVPKLVRDATGAATVEAPTVMFDRKGEAQFGAVVARGVEGWRTLARTEEPDAVARLLDRDTHPVGAAGTITLDAQSRPYWNFA